MDVSRRTPRTIGIIAAGAVIASLLPVGTMATASAAPSSSAEVACPPPSGAANSENIAATAQVTASYTAPWNNISAVSDGESVHEGGQQSQLWGTYSSDRPSQQWLQYAWTEERTLTEASVAFWSDATSATAGDGIAAPRTWRLQSWNGSAWIDVPVSGAGYSVDRTAVNTVTFTAPVVTNRLRAVFDAASNGSTFAAVAVSEFSVTGTSGSTDGTEWLSSDSFTLGISRETGGVYHLSNASDAGFCTNYVANPSLRPAFDTDDSRWVGDLVMRTNGVPRVTGLSDDTRTVTKDGDKVTVSYRGDAANPNGIRGFALDETYALSGAAGDVLDWSIRFDNSSAAPLTIEDLGIPLLMNAWWEGGNQTGIYEQNVGRDSFVAEDGSYMYWQRPNGEGPYLVMVPQEGTSLEFKDKARPGEGPFAEQDPSWEGLVEYYIHSAQAAPARVAEGKAAQFLPASSATVQPGEDRSYGFTFRWADDYEDLRDVLYDAGVVDVVSLPGMTIPTDMKATLAVRAKSGIDAVVGGGGLEDAGSDAVITRTGVRNGYELYDISFASLGENFVTVEYGGGKTSVLQYYSIEPVEKLIEANASFITENQQAKSPTKGYDGAYLQWDMRTKQQVTRGNFSSVAVDGIDEFRLRWMTGGSDDIGLSPAAFVAEKNALDPAADEIQSLDYYIDNFLLGYLQNQFANGERTWNLYHWYDGGDGDRPATGRDDGTSPDVGDGLATWRVMNSPHVWNTYFSMYKIAQQHPDLTARTAAEYLDFAYRTMKAYFEHDDARRYLPDSSRDLASMGELSLPLVQDALRREGRTTEADLLEGFLHEKYMTLSSRKYPFASEMSIDTTAFEGNYTLAKKYGDDALVRKVTLASLASRGTQPLWYFYGSDVRHMGESWWNLGYETQLGAWQQQDYAENYDVIADGIDPDELMRSTYGAYLAGWANINSGQISADPSNLGAASWIYQSEKGLSEYGFIPNLDGWWAWSGESALGFWGGLQTASVNVVDDDVVGAYSYGGDLTVSQDAYTITPKDGVRQRLTMYNEDKFALELSNAKYTSATVDKDLSRVVVELDRPGVGAVSPGVKLSNLPAGKYSVMLDGIKLRQATETELAAGFDLPSSTTTARTLSVAAVPVDRVAPVSTVITDPVGGAVEQGRTVTARFSATDAESGVAKTEYSLDGGAVWTSATEGGVSFDTVGEHPVLYRSVDAAGNVEQARTVTLTVTPARATAKATITAGDQPSVDGWYRQNVLVRLESAQSGQKVQYRIDDGTWSTSSRSLTISKNGSTTVAHRLLWSGVVVPGSESRTEVKIDKQVPIVGVLRTPSTGTGTPRNPISLSFSAADTVSGLGAVEYRVNDGGWLTVGPESVVFDEPGDWLISYRAHDRAGNSSATKSVSVTIAANVPTSIKSSAKTVKPGAAVTLTLVGYERWDEVSVTIGGTPVGQVLTDHNGAARVTVRVPAAAVKGDTPITASGTDPAVTASVLVAIKP